MKKIKLTRGKYALVDDALFPFFRKWNWSCGSGDYATRGVTFNGKSKAVKLHRTAAYIKYGFIPDGFFVDHIDRDPLNNQLVNIRLATKQQNCFNAKKKNNKYRGVHKYGNSWRLRFSVNRKTSYFGSFENEIEAARKYDELVLAYRGEFAVLNFPEEHLKEIEHENS